MKVITAPDIISIPQSATSLFLAGSIDMDTAPNWQKEFIELADPKLGDDWVILNPRRKKWDSSWEQRMSNPHFYQQVDWEMQGLEKADHVFFNFSRESKSPITFLELGMQASNVWRTYVICPDGFYRKGNIEIFCHKKGIPMFESFDDVIAQLLKSKE